MAKLGKKVAESKRRNGVAAESENEDKDQQGSNGNSSSSNPSGRLSKRPANKRKAPLTVASGSEDTDDQSSNSNVADVTAPRNKRKVGRGRKATTSAGKNGKKVAVADSVGSGTEDSDDQYSDAADVSTPRNKRKVGTSRKTTTSAGKNGKKVAVEDSEDDANDSDVDLSVDGSSKKTGIKRKSRRSVRPGTEDSDDLPSTSKAAADASNPIKKRKLSRAKTSSAKNGKKAAEEDSEVDDDVEIEEDQSPQPQVVAKSKATQNVKKTKARGRPTAGAKKVDATTDPEKEWEVEKIIDHVVTKEGDMFKIRWKKYGPQDDSWEPRKNLACDALIEKFMRELLTQQNVDVKELRESPKKTERLVDECYPRTNLHNRIERSSKRSAAKNRIFYGED
ncbi:nucleolar and coiled-body phosphoprotein 1 isoform X2 [Drosophila teissieri]|uniref:nucleolar and coiled-body phosphoprotein 1 isoform X2 n=1 Tax=Drosophila teissieri TaxID=7243 RepID=UPI001CBA5B07|nr:nucleolar and coiled-body phosphoprotein 1 isoform X2 [Drosophila teissieri]